MIKSILIKWFLKEEKLKLDQAYIRIQATIPEYEKAQKEARERFMKAFNVKEYIFKELAGFKPELIARRKAGINPRSGEPFVDGDIVEAAKKAGIEETELLANASSIANNRVFAFIIEYLVSNQILLTFYNSPNADGMNFGRALAGGMSEVKDEFERLRGVHESKKNPPEDFDKHAAI